MSVGAGAGERKGGVNEVGSEGFAGGAVDSRHCFSLVGGKAGMVKAVEEAFFRFMDSFSLQKLSLLEVACPPWPQTRGNCQLMRTIPRRLSASIIGSLTAIHDQETDLHISSILHVPHCCFIDFR